MRPVKRRGYTVIELIVAMVLTSIVAAAALRAFLGVRAVYVAVGNRLGQNAALRDAAVILPYELRALGSGPGAPSQDLAALTSTSITYRAAGTLLFVCEEAPGPTRRLVLDAGASYGVRSLDATRDSVLVLTVDTTAAPPRGAWIAVDLLGLRPTSCPGGGPGMEATLSRSVARAPVGTALRGFQPTELRMYRDRTGVRWLGARTARKLGGWSVTQPILGPLEVDGLQVVGYDAAGAVTSDPAKVVRLGATVTALGAPRSAAIGISLQIALRNTQR